MSGNAVGKACCLGIKCCIIHWSRRANREKFGEVFKSNKKHNEFSTHKEYINYKQSVPTFFGILTLVVFGLIGYGVYTLDSILPINETNSFSSDDALNYLNGLVNSGDTTSRVVGSDNNEIDAVKYITESIKSMGGNIELDVQNVAGSFYLDNAYGSINAYANIQNVVAKVRSTHPSNSSILINAHFDTVPDSPGASDDAIMCAIMLSILKDIALKESLNHDVIFLFNGAEETGFQGSHGFITKHKWAKYVQLVINLDATGLGGKEMLFQTGGQTWLLDYYSKVPRPHAQASGEEVFDSNIIPSDTDYRIFRDFGTNNIIGYDMAYTRNGYYYHTKYDAISSFSSTRELEYTILHTGENVLKLLETLLEAPELDEPNPDEINKTVYFDFLGLFLIHYNRTVEITINLFLAVISICSLIFCFIDYSRFLSKNDSNNTCLEIIKYLAINIVGVVLGWIISIGIAVLIGVIIDALGLTMKWYNHPWLVLGMYCCPIFLINCLTIILLDKINNNKYPNLHFEMQVQLQIHVNRLIWTILLLLGTILEIRSVYIFYYNIAFTAIACIIIESSVLKTKCITWKMVYLLFAIIPFVFNVQMALEILYLFIPITGRNGSDSNPEILVALICGVITIITTSYFVPFVTSVRKNISLICYLSIIFVIFFIITWLTVAYNPGNKMQRYNVCHTNRIVRNSAGIIINDSGYMFTNSDRNSPFKKLKDDYPFMRILGDDCKKALFCGVPTKSSRGINKLANANWIPANPPIENNPKLSLKAEKIYSNSSFVSYSIKVEGPDRLNIYISPKETIQVLNMGIINDLPETVLEWNGRPAYYISYVCGKPTMLQFTIDFKIPPNYQAELFDIALAAQYVHDFETTPGFKEFLRSFYDYTVVSSSVGAYESWVF